MTTFLFSSLEVFSKRTNPTEEIPISPSKKTMGQNSHNDGDTLEQRWDSTRVTMGKYLRKCGDVLRLNPNQWIFAAKEKQRRKESIKISAWTILM